MVSGVKRNQKGTAIKRNRGHWFYLQFSLKTFKKPVNRQFTGFFVTMYGRWGNLNAHYLYNDYNHG